MRLQKMSQSTGLLAELEEDHGLSNLATKNDQRTCASFCHLELIRYELGFLGKLEEDFLVPHPGIPMRMARCDERLSLGSRSDRNPGGRFDPVFDIQQAFVARGGGGPPPPAPMVVP